MIAARPKSDAIYTASLERMPGGVNSPVRAFKGLDMTPMIVEREKGIRFGMSMAMLISTTALVGDL